jgi:serine protease Do
MRIALKNAKTRERGSKATATLRALQCLFVLLFTQLSLLRADAGTPSEDGSSFTAVARSVQPKVVKLYGAGGLQGLEAYQSGLLISAEGHILTIWSYVLDVDEVTAVLDDGRRLDARLVAVDPLTEIAVLKFDPGEERLPYFDLSQAATAEPASRVLAFSNLFGIAVGNEPVSVLFGVVSAVAPLEARRGAFDTPFRGDVYIVDAAANNPGAAGGALTDAQGRLLGMLGKELRSNVTGTWLNYALPVSAFSKSVEEILAGRFTPPELRAIDQPERPQSLAHLGIVLVPDVVNRTPPYIDRVLPNSAALAAGLRPDDLLVMIDGQVAASCRAANELIRRLEADAAVPIAVLRGGALLQVTLQANLDHMPAATRQQ